MSNPKENSGKGRRGGGKRLTARQAGVKATDGRAVIEEMNRAFAGKQFDAEIMPEPIYLDRTKPDRDAFMERVKPLINKDHIKELLRRGGDFLKGVFVADVAGGMNFVPTTGFQLAIPTASLPIGVGEPRWRPGRDRNGNGGGGPDATDDPADLVFIDLTWEELAELLSLLFDLPFLLAKEEEKILAYTLKVKGIKPTGPRARLDVHATFRQRLARFRATIQSRPQDFPGLTAEMVPTTEEFPFHDKDLRYKRIEEKWDPDSKAVVFFIFDTSGSMGGEPMAIARLYFLLNLIWLKSRYGEVSVVFLPHNAVAVRVNSEEEFFRVDAGGGTLFTPAYEETVSIAEREFPASVYNRYAFHATDGYGFDGPGQIADGIENIIRHQFNYFGYLEIDPYGWGGSRSTPGYMAIDMLSESIRQHVGDAKVSTLDEVPDAMKQILTKDTSV